MDMRPGPSQTVSCTDISAASRGAAMTGKDLTIRVATTAMDVAGGAYGMAGIGAALNPLIQDLLHLQDEQVQAVRRIEMGVQQLLDAPWKNAKFHLEECSLPGRSPKEIKLSLQKAADKLLEARSHHQRGFAEAYVLYDLAVVSVLAQDNIKSRHYAEMSAEAATNTVIDSIL